MATFTELTSEKTVEGSIKGWINWSKAPSSIVLTEAQAFIYSRLRVREMKALTVGTIAANATTLILPADFIATKSWRRTGATAGPIHHLDIQHFEERLPLDENSNYISEAPTECMVIGDPPTAHFNFKANAATPYRLVYYKRPSALSAINETNFLTERYPMMLRATCLAFANSHQKNDNEYNKWLKLAGGEIDNANSEADMAEQINRFEPYWEN